LSDLLVIEFQSEATADRVRETLLAIHKEYRIRPGPPSLVTDDSDIKLNQLLQPVGRGAVSGMPWGSLICLLFMMPRASAASATLGSRPADLGINDDCMRQAARTLQSGNAALFLLIRKMTANKVLAALRGTGGSVMRSSFDETKEEALREALAAAGAATS
jgi:uncharacterized membrane protein